ncbi:uncharacterized protein SPSK_05748 [Sporothrix schenckii 1099-18]|uniref:Uncharacterized protein n=1 Tax=Sporothrix schenckii 1099-18 TaxID=1397361 RepID=A0A0F2LUG8_SPOSC|nr:uncharacterized protein SPSK_05748 [Sporothrix schenckii 1099-18]KJR81112.1 hypothetical protein SPSK_05748 [Sporothrix schenckii 1099-18]
MPPSGRFHGPFDFFAAYSQVDPDWTQQLGFAQDARLGFASFCYAEIGVHARRADPFARESYARNTLHLGPRVVRCILFVLLNLII